MTGIRHIVSEAVITYELFFLLYLIGKYVYLKFQFASEKEERRGMTAVLLILFASSVAASYWEGVDVAGILLCYGALAIYAERGHIRNLFSVIPSFGILCGLLSVFIGLSGMVQGNIGSMLGDSNNKQSELMRMDYLVIGLMIFFFFGGRKWRVQFQELIHQRRMDRGERWVLNLAGWLQLILMLVLVSLQELQLRSEYYSGIYGLLLAIVCVLHGLIIMTVVQRNRRFQYQNLAELNEYYLKVQLKHFKNYQHQQQETRRIRHDMKNHLCVISQLVQQEKKQELLTYLDELDIPIQELCTNYNSGSDIVDAILGEKQEEARLDDITIQLDGNFTEAFAIESVDLCTIFSNALDNAIEELREHMEVGRTIRVSIQNQNQICLFSFENQVREEVRKPGTRKKDVINHGFGLENIRRTAKKYQGTLETSIVETPEKERFFSLKVMLLCGL